jgi:hypothetical protein
MSNNISHIAPEERSGTVDGVSVQFQAYMNDNGEKRVIWKVGQASGNGAQIESESGKLRLPQERQIRFNGETLSKLSLPRWMLDGLTTDFARLDTPSKGQQPTTNDDGDDEPTSMFETPGTSDR